MPGSSEPRPLQKIKVVLDTNVLISFLLTSNKTISRLFDLWDTGEIENHYSKDTIIELRRALSYPRLRIYIDNKAAEALVDKVEMLGVHVSSREKLNVVRDPEDNKFIEAALVAGASYVVTGDKDLLSLMEVRGVKVVNPKEFIELVG